MTEARALLKELRLLGAKIQATDHHRLIINAPVGTLSGELRARIRRRKAEVLAVLENPQTWHCASCQSEWFVFSEPGVVCYWCRAGRTRIC